MILVQVKLLDGYGVGALAIRLRFDRADMFALAAHDDDAPASQIAGRWASFGGLHSRGSAALNG